MGADLTPDSATVHEGFASVGRGELYYREAGRGRPILVLHGGPDFDHGYLLPDLDRLADLYHLIYYDQRGRGRSAPETRPEDVTLSSEIEDLETLRAFFQLESSAILGHSWGALLAMEYAIRHPQRVSHLILMNPTPASHDDLMLMSEARAEEAADDVEDLEALAATPRYQAGDLEVEAEYYRIHFRATIRDREMLERLVRSLRSNFTPESVLRARAIERQLYASTWWSEGYDLLPQLKRLLVPTLVVYGDDDFVPRTCVAHIADAIPEARFVLLEGCGHFTYLECPDAVRAEVAAFLGPS